MSGTFSKYTVVGIDDYEKTPWEERVAAADPEEAVGAAVKQRDKLLRRLSGKDNGGGVDPENTCIVAVYAGHHKTLLENEYIYAACDHPAARKALGLPPDQFHPDDGDGPTP